MEDIDAMLICEGVTPADQDTVIKAWQHLIDTGLCWQLQGWFGRQAQQAIDKGICTSPYSHKDNPGLDEGETIDCFD